MNKKDIKILTKAGWTVEDDRITHWDTSSASGTAIDLVLKNIYVVKKSPSHNFFRCWRGAFGL